MLKQLFNKAFLLLSRFAADPEDSEEWRVKKVIGIFSVSSGIPLLLGYGLLYMAFNERSAALVDISAAVLWFIGLLIYSVYRNYAATWTYMSITYMLAIILKHYFLGGFAQSGMVIIYLLLLSMLSLVMYNLRHGLIVFLISVVIFLGAAYLEPYYLRPTNNFPPTVITALYVMNLTFVGVFMILGVYYYIWRNEMLSKLLSIEQNKTEALLSNMLPGEIATILKNENRVIADHFDGVSILFADVANFTPMSAKMSPTELVELLNDVFSCFDTFVEKYGLEKIKTIGDCYMVAAGVPRQRTDHAHILTRLALNMRDHTRQHTFQGKQLVFRIGVNSGPAVAGVIGHKKFSYDLWGDTVNTASRMESHGTAGTVQITEATYELIKNDFVCEPRGVVNVKGKGEMNVWSVMESKA